VPSVHDAARSARYTIHHQIGLGGHAEVLLGVVRGADGFHRSVAIKRVRQELADQARFETMLIEEAHHAARLSHPNVVSVLDLERDTEGRPYLVMEHVDGVDLATLIETGPLPCPVAIFIVRELLSALGYIHDSWDQGRDDLRGLVHRDVKPRNVLLSWAGEVKLADFGVAMTVGASAHLGTAGYMSPEQARGEELDGRSDLYALGIVLWELLAFERLRVGLPGDVGATAAFDRIRPPSEYRQVPADLEAVAMRLLAHDREDRYLTAELVARDLMRCRDVPRDGRGDLVHLLEERFPRAGRRGSCSLQPELTFSSVSPSTVTASPGAPMDAPPWPSEQWAQCYASMLERARRRRQARAYGIVFALMLATAIVLLMVR
jgi:serine/threonine protein kinase